MTAYSLEKIRRADHDWLIELHNDPEVLRNMTDSSPVTVESHRKWWASVQNNPREERWIFTVDGQRAGLVKIIGIDFRNQNCLSGGDIHLDFRGQGHGVPMWKLLLARCFESLALHRVGLTVAAYNHRAIHVYEKLGFVSEGRLIQSLWRNGDFHDQISMYLLRPNYFAEKL